MKQALAELNKIVLDNRPKPSQNEIPNGENNFQSYKFSIHAIPCSSLEEVKNRIKNYYQKKKWKLIKILTSRGG
ncbi:MAG: hypothetical protein NY202_04550 [Mollicutes bacterium UO1]